MKEDDKVNAEAQWRLSFFDREGNREISGDSTVDEFLINDWFHLEMMKASHWWIRVGSARINVELRDGKPPLVTITPDCYDEESGETIVSPLK